APGTPTDVPAPVTKTRCRVTAVSALGDSSMPGRTMRAWLGGDARTASRAAAGRPSGPDAPRSGHGHDGENHDDDARRQRGGQTTARSGEHAPHERPAAGEQELPARRGHEG